MKKPIELAERGLLPDTLIRFGIRRLLRDRLRTESRGGCEAMQESMATLLEEMRRGPIAIETDTSKEQHYEVPTEFFRLILGSHLKYSCCRWGPGVTDLNQAEEEMLRLTAERAGVEDGMEVLDLGCGWGALSLWIAERMPGCRVRAVSHSATQGDYIHREAERRGLKNVTHKTADMNRFEPSGSFDRVVSVEMFEHMRNWEALLGRIASWLAPGGRLFLHVFSHRRHPYFYETDDPSDWMARHFFTGGLMPSDDLLLFFQRDLSILRRWNVSGTHYEKTLLAWLEKLDQRRDEVRAVLEPVYGAADVDRWVQRWRIFLLASAELFGWDGGQEWLVSHYLMGRRGEEESS